MAIYRDVTPIHFLVLCLISVVILNITFTGHSSSRSPSLERDDRQQGHFGFSHGSNDAGHSRSQEERRDKRDYDPIPLSRNDSLPIRRFAQATLEPSDHGYRRSREGNTSPTDGMGADAKRRRTEEKNSDSTFARRDRSASPNGYRRGVPPFSNREREKIGVFIFAGLPFESYGEYQLDQ